LCFIFLYLSPSTVIGYLAGFQHHRKKRKKREKGKNVEAVCAIVLYGSSVRLVQIEIPKGYSVTGI
jgi:hypothetical protein